MRPSISIAALLLSVTALAQGVVLSPEQLPEVVRTELLSKLSAAQQREPEAFKAFLDVRAALEKMDKNKRGRQPAMSPVLRGLGASALYPLIKEAAVSASPRGELKATAWSAWRLAVLEVLGELRSADAAPIFITLLESGEPDFELNRMAAEALGDSGTDAAAKALVKLAQGPRRDAVLGGMGSCRRTVIAQTLAAAVAKTTDTQSLMRLAHSLGQVGNSWAWQTPAVAAAKSEEGTVREVAARALVQILVKPDSQATQGASNALMVVDAEKTPALIDEAKRTASGTTLVRLEQAEQRFARNPTR